MTSATAAAAPASVAARLITTEQTAQRISDCVAEAFAGDDVAVSLADTGSGRWQVAVHFRTPPDEPAVRATIAAAAGAEAAAALEFAPVAATDWVRESLAGLPPVAAGRFVVHGAHDRTHVAANRIGIEIEAALAFGTGHHGTTRGCLLALDRICKSPQRPLRILDVGTGSGVLAIAAAKALRMPVIASDIDAAAVAVARANAQLNRAGGLIEFIRADGVTARRLRERAPFDLVFANILLKPLQRIAAPLRNLLAPGGRLILSGILPSQANAAMAVYRPLVLGERLDHRRLDHARTWTRGRRVCRRGR